MNTTLNPDYEEQLIIGRTDNLDVKLADDYKVLYSIANYDELYNFIQKNNKTDNSNNICLLPIELMKKLNNKCSCFTSVLSNNSNATRVKLDAFCLSLILPVKIDKLTTDKLTYSDKSYDEFNDNTVLFGYTNYLCVSEEKRKVALGIAAVRLTLQYGREKGIQFGYFLEYTPKSTNNIKIFPWYRVINYASANKAGYKIADVKKVGDRDDRRLKLYYDSNIPKGYEIIKINGTGGANLVDYKKLVADKTICYYPSQIHWEYYCKMFDVYMVKNGSNIVGMYSVTKTNVYIRTTGMVSNVCNLLWCVGLKLEVYNVLKCVVNTASKMNVDILGGFIMGDVVTDAVVKLKCMFTTPMYLEYYNTSIKHKIENINLPLY
jgi:hypothetical protein